MPSSALDMENYKLLDIMEFMNARKRMSVVLCKLGGEDEALCPWSMVICS